MIEIAIFESFQADKARNNKELKTLKNGNEHLSGKLCKIEENEWIIPKFTLLTMKTCGMDI